MLDPKPMMEESVRLLKAIDNKDVAAPLAGFVAGLIDGCVALSAALDEVRAKLNGLDPAATKAQKLSSELADWMHGEDCPKHCHDECGPDEREPGAWYCDAGDPRDECEPRECECGVERAQTFASEILVALSVVPRPAAKA